MNNHKVFGSFFAYLKKHFFKLTAGSVLLIILFNLTTIMLEKMMGITPSEQSDTSYVMLWIYRIDTDLILEALKFVLFNISRTIPMIILFIYLFYFVDKQDDNNRIPHKKIFRVAGMFILAFAVLYLSEILFLWVFRVFRPKDGGFVGTDSLDNFIQAGLFLKKFYSFFFIGTALIKLLPVINFSGSGSIRLSGKQQLKCLGGLILYIVLFRIVQLLFMAVYFIIPTDIKTATSIVIVSGTELINRDHYFIFYILLLQILFISTFPALLNIFIRTGSTGDKVKVNV